MLGLPDGVSACLFDLDGVLTQTAKVHAKAWKQRFDAYLREHAERHGEQFAPFHAVTDYDEYVDGKPRYEGVQSVHDDGVQPYDGSVRHVHAVKDTGLTRAVVSSGTVVVDDLADLLSHR